MNILFFWIITGFIVNIFYFSLKHELYTKSIKEGEINVKSLMIGFILTLFLFPVTIYNNEIRKK